MSQKITIAYGDGIGPEIMEACLSILKKSGADLNYEVIEIGENVYKKGHTSGISEQDWDTLVKNHIFLKSPITTPQGGGYKSLNVTIRKTLGLYANIRPVKSLHPFVQTKHPKMDMVIVRENEEDLYAGIEHRQTQEVYQCLKLISAPGSEKIIRFAFEYAKSVKRKKITCMTKDNIMKLTDGLFHKTFDEVAKDYPEMDVDHWIIDIGAAKIADSPEDFDVIVVPNLYGDIVSDIAAQITGSVGMAGSANIGAKCAMFEAIHGSAPTIAGQNIANPSGLLMGAVQMLNYIGQSSVAEKIENAWLTTIEEGIHTGDIYDQNSKEKVSTQDFSKAVIERLGSKPQTLKAVEYGETSQKISIHLKEKPKVEKKLEGMDVFIDCDDRRPDVLGEKLIAVAQATDLKLVMITNRGVKVFPKGNPHTFCTDHWRCRFMHQDDEKKVTHQELIELQQKILEANLEVIKTENLYRFGEERGYSLGQGQ
ncbi:NADP-dependent isocitrate dehydrogenase [bacterium]|nr:NADP-dependent isocitrate dehydrogenase [bacterium]